MTSPSDIVELPGQPGLFTRRIVADAWVRAGSPRVNSAGRLYSEQKRLRQLFLAGQGSPADDPDHPDIFPLAHVRFGALDIDATPERVQRLSAAGLIRPYSYEPWHWEIPNVRQFGLVTYIPASAYTSATTFVPKEDTMTASILLAGKHYYAIGEEFISHHGSVAQADITRQINSASDELHKLNLTQFWDYLDGEGIPRSVVNPDTGYILNPETGKYEFNGVWSRRREAVAKSTQILIRLDALDAALKAQAEAPKA